MKVIKECLKINLITSTCTFDSLHFFQGSSVGMLCTYGMNPLKSLCDIWHFPLSLCDTSVVYTQCGAVKCANSFQEMLNYYEILLILQPNLYNRLSHRLDCRFGVLCVFIAHFCKFFYHYLIKSFTFRTDPTSLWFIHILSIRITLGH